jgi:protein-S-isoprenylcysteine O-methyltransferase Ste14
MRRTAMITSGVALTLAAVGQVVLTFVLYRENGIAAVRNVGWAIMGLSAIFGWLPILTFRRMGGVSKGRSYMETTVLVNRGVYAIVRHPQYLAGVLLGVGFSLIAQHWLVGVLGAVVVVESYASTFPEEQALREKFGVPYEEYTKRVPRMNFALGLLRLLRRESEGGGPRG